MNVGELIKKLQTFPKNAIVVTTSDNFEMNNATVELKSVYSFKGEIVEKRFRDAFDGGSYTSKVIRHLGDDDGKHGLTFIQVG